MGKAADWLREERRNVLGHWTAFCLDCGAAQRWFVEHEAEVPEACACGGRILRRCPSCDAPFWCTASVLFAQGQAMRNGAPWSMASDRTEPLDHGMDRGIGGQGPREKVLSGLPGQRHHPRRRPHTHVVVDRVLGHRTAMLARPH